MSVLLSLSGLSIGYAGGRRTAPRVVAQDLDLEVRRGELVCLIGANGAGKSTLLRTLAGVKRPLAGKIRLAGDDLSQLEPRQRARKLAVVLTDRIGIGLLTARSVVELGRHPHTGWSGRLSGEDHRQVDQALARVGASHLAARELVSLSDGEQQRVMIARALAQQPELLVLDEVTAFLDLPRRIEILALLRRLARENACGVLLSIHDLDLALRHADQVWAMSRPSGSTGGPGTIVCGAPEDLVLSGEMGKLLAAEGLVFDPLKGSFDVPRAAAGRARVEGEGLGALWAGRALERLGFELSAEDLEGPLVRASKKEDGWSFQLERQDEQQDEARLFSSIAELGGFLRRSRE